MRMEARVAWRRGPFRQQLCSGMLERNGPWRYRGGFEAEARDARLEIVYFTETREVEHEAGAAAGDGRQVARAPPRTGDVAIEIGKPEAEAEEEDSDGDGAWMGEYSDYSGNSDGDY